MDTPSMLPIIQQVPIFIDLTQEQHGEIIKNIVLNYYPVGYVFFHEGDVPDANASMYIIKHGMVKISGKDEHGIDQQIAVLSDDSFFGEMAFVLEAPRNATATAISECEVFELKKSAFQKLLESSPNGAAKISTAFMGRLKENEKNRPAKK